MAAGLGLAFFVPSSFLLSFSPLQASMGFNCLLDMAHIPALSNTKHSVVVLSFMVVSFRLAKCLQCEGNLLAPILRATRKSQDYRRHTKIAHF